MIVKTLLFLFFALIIIALSFMIKDGAIDNHFDVDKKAHYILEYHTKFTKQNSYGVIGDIDLNAQIDFRVFQNTKKVIYAGFELSKVAINIPNKDLQESLKKLYEVFFIVKMDKNGKILEYYFPGKEDNFKGLIMLFSTLQTVFKNEKEYKVTEFDANGFYSVSYKKDNLQIHKSKIKYLQAAKSNILFKSSDINITVDAKGNFINSLIGKEIVQTKEANQTVLQNSNMISFQKLTTKIDTTLRIWQEQRDVKDIINSLQQKAKTQELFWKEEAQKSNRKYIKKEKLELENFITKMEKNPSIESMRDLQKYLKLFPKKTAQLYRVILNTSDDTSMKIVNVLELLGTKEAQKLLLDLIDTSDEDLSQINHLRAIIALGAVESVSEENIEKLWQYSQNEETPNLQERSQTIILALGNIASHSNDYIAQSINERLKDRLVEDDYRVKKIALLAMQNSGIDHFKTEVLDLLKNSTNEKLQLSAISLLKSVHNEDVMSTLYQKIIETDSDRIKAKAIESISYFNPDAKVVKLLQKELLTESNPRIKSEMVRYLANSMDSYPDNKNYLESALQNESNREVVKLIIKSIKGKGDEK